MPDAQIATMLIVKRATSSNLPSILVASSLPSNLEKCLARTRFSPFRTIELKSKLKDGDDPS